MYRSTTQEEEPDDDVTKTSFWNSEDEGSTLGARAERLNSSMHEADTVRTVAVRTEPHVGHVRFVYICDSARIDRE